MVYFSPFGIVNALGNSAPEVRTRLAAIANGGAKSLFQCFDLKTGKIEENDTGQTECSSCVPAAVVRGELPEIPVGLEEHASRNNQLLLAALAQIQVEVGQAFDRFGPERVGVILGTSNSGIEEALYAVAAREAGGALPPGYHYGQQELGSPARFLAAHLGAQGPCYTISTACSSSARAFISAARLLKAGIADAVVAGGADALCRLALNGFKSLSALSRTGCRPFAADRDGITIGEAAALTVITREPLPGAPPVALFGYGESSDAHHASAPHPEGIGAEAAMRSALASARLSPGDIGYVNLHGTGTPLNDAMESLATHRVFDAGAPCSSTKHLTGHTLGTCAATEAALCHLLLTTPPGASPLSLPAQVFTECSPRDPALAPIALVAAPGLPLERPRILSSSFAFGGNNACLVLGIP